MPTIARGKPAIINLELVPLFLVCHTDETLDVARPRGPVPLLMQHYCNQEVTMFITESNDTNRTRLSFGVSSPYHWVHLSGTTDLEMLPPTMRER